MKPRLLWLNRSSSHGTGTHLVPGANVLLAAVQVDALGDVGRLLLQGHQHIARLVVKTWGRAEAAMSLVHRSPRRR